MPISKPATHFARRSAFTLLLAAAAALACVAAWVLYVDPYSVWRAEPISGDMGALDRKMRFAKTLQIYTRPIKTAFVGSSTVYRGIDPGKLPPSLVAHNLGVSSLRATEMATFMRALARFGHPDDVVIGLDYFMFDRERQTEAGFDAAIDQPLHAAELLLYSLVGKDAVADACAAWKGRRTVTEDGAWLGNGYKKTFDRPAMEVQRIRLNTGKEYAAMRYDAALLAKVEEAIVALRAGGARVHLFLSPVHADFYQLIGDAGQSPDYRRFKADVAALAQKTSVDLRDFSDFQKSERGLAGSDANWIDITHYQSTAGTAMVQDMLGMRR